MGSSKREQFEQEYPAPDSIRFEPSLGKNGSYISATGSLQSHNDAHGHNLLWAGFLAGRKHRTSHASALCLADVREWARYVLDSPQSAEPAGAVAHLILNGAPEYIHVGMVEPIIQVNWLTNESKGVALLKGKPQPGLPVYMKR